MARSIQQHGHHVTCALIGMSCKLAAYNYTSSLALSTSWWSLSCTDAYVSKLAIVATLWAL